jgi:hypothetical protein
MAGSGCQSAVGGHVVLPGKDGTRGNQKIRSRRVRTRCFKDQRCVWAIDVNGKGCRRGCVRGKKRCREVNINDSMFHIDV